MSMCVCVHVNPHLASQMKGRVSSLVQRINLVVCVDEESEEAVQAMAVCPTDIGMYGEVSILVSGLYVDSISLQIIKDFLEQ